MNPLISVIIPVHNAAATIVDTIESLRRQTEPNYEMLVIENGSKDETLSILKQYAKRDERIKVMVQDEPGLVRALNRGIAQAQGRFIARMDADDLAHPERFRRQMDFLSSSDLVGICGTQIDFEVNGTKRISKYPLLDVDIRLHLLRRTPICHPTLMFARERIKKESLYYVDTYPHAEDFELMIRLSFETKISNMEDVLLFYRRHEGQVTERHKPEMNNSVIRVASKLYHSLGLTEGEEESRNLWDILTNSSLTTSGSELRKRVLFLKDLSYRKLDDWGIEHSTWKRHIIEKMHGFLEACDAKGSKVVWDSICFGNLGFGNFGHHSIINRYLKRKRDRWMQSIFMAMK